MKFIGIDLAWRSGWSGLCCLEWQPERLDLLDLTREQAIESVLAWVDRWVKPTEAAAIAVDAPTIITNPNGMRLAERLTHRYFGRYHAGCYPANLARPFAQRTTDFGLQLAKRGFAHAPTIKPQKPGRYQIEVFPHPATINLFKLERILKYKKGILAQRKAELTKLYRYILEVLPRQTPSLNLEPPFLLESFNALTGAALKAIEDQLDSLICAYIAAHWWYWGEARNWVLGDADTGYIVVPAPVGEQGSRGAGEQGRAV